MLSQLILFIFLSFLLIGTIGKIICPFIETLSFGSDINIKCNKSYLIFNEINNNGINWKFANRTLNCEQKGSQKAFVNQCGITQINSNYLAVQLKSVHSHEEACAYCRINGKSMVPIISVVQTDAVPYKRYVFNITATALAKNQSFEILWAKRVHDTLQYSYNYWFIQRCIHRTVQILDNTPHRIIFAVDDVTINRVELIIRRCNESCRTYNICEHEEFNKAIQEHFFEIPDSIEKISCDSKCLYGSKLQSLPPTIPYRREISSITSTTTKSSPNRNPMREFAILIILIGILLSVILAILIRYIIFRSNNKKSAYAKTSSIDPDETK